MKTVLSAILLSILTCSVLAAEPTGSVAISTDSYVSPDYNLTQNKAFSYISVGFNNLENRQVRGGLEDLLQANVEGRFSPQVAATSYLNVSELYLQSQLFSVGRRKFNWSNLDDIWSLGLYQPVFRWNPLLPSAQGLTGLFVELSSKESSIPYGFMLFGSMLYVPDQGASYELVDGQFRSVNPWFKAPPQNVIFGKNMSGKIYYDIQIPEVNEVLFNQSYAAQFYAGDKNNGLRAQASVAYKPANQLMLGAYAEPATNQPAVIFTIRPQIFMHTLFSGDLTYARGPMTFGLSVLHERPKESDFPSQFAYKTYSSSTLTSPFLRYSKGSIQAQVSTLNVSDLTETQVGASFVASNLPKRYPFERAWRGDIKWQNHWRHNQGIEANLGYLSGFKDEFSLVTLGAGWQLDSHWRIFSDLLLVRANEEQDAAGDFQNLQNNDLFSLGVSYVF